MAALENTKMREIGFPEGSPGLVLDRPADKSLAAFKRWIKQMTGALGNSGDGSMTEKDWREAWKTFWSDESDG